MAMIALAARTARARAGTLAGPFIALALGTALLSAVVLNMIADVGAGAGPPRWYTQPAVVVAGLDTVRVTAMSGGDRETETVRTGAARPVPAGAAARLAARMSALGVPVVTDYAGPAHAAGVPGSTLHPWAAAALHRYAWVAGGPPRATAPGRLPQVVLSAPTRLRPGERLTLQTAAGPRAFTVSGVIRTAAQPALYAAGPVAAQLAGHQIAAIALLPRPGWPSPAAQSSPGAQSGSGAHAGQGAQASQESRARPAALAAQARAVTRGWPVRVLTGAGRAGARAAVLRRRDRQHRGHGDGQPPP
jgi:putative ABC transport system permease protein